MPGANASPCDIGGKGELGSGSSWSGAFTGAGAEIGLNVETGTNKNLNKFSPDVELNNNSMYCRDIL